MFGRRRMWRRWPRSRRLGPRRIRISGRCAEITGTRFGRGALSIAAAGSALLLAASATQGLWMGSVPEGTVAYAAACRLADLRWLLRDVLIVRFPGIAATIAYDPLRPLDWHLAAAAAALLALRRPLAAVGGWLAAQAFAARFTVVVTPQTLMARKGWRAFRLSRERGVPLRIRAVGPEEYLSAERAERLREETRNGQPPAVVEISHGFRRYPLLFAMRSDRAEAIVARCNEALAATEPLMPELS